MGLATRDYPNICFDRLENEKMASENEKMANEVSDIIPLIESTHEDDTDRSNEERDALKSALDSAGYGGFHLLLLVVCSLALASDTIEIFCIAYVLPVAEGELQLSGVDKAILNSVTFVGMILGGLLFGSLADAIGRQRSLVLSLFLNSISGFLSAFLPTLPVFVMVRFFSGVGIGGSLPVVFSYFCEFFSAKRMGPFMISLNLTWSVFGTYAPLLAWAMLSNPCLIDTHLGSMPFRTWRVYVMLCAVPAFLSAVLFIFMPESPSWHFSGGRYSKVLRTLNHISKINSIVCLWRQKIYGVVTQVGMPTDDCTEAHDAKENNIETPNCGKHAGTHLIEKIGHRVLKALRRYRCLFTKTYVRITLLLLISISALSCGSYGFQLWLPVYFNNLLKNETVNGTTGGCSVVGENCTQLDSSCSQVYLDSLLVSASGIPGTILGILTINIVGGRAQITTSMVLSGLSVFFIWWVPPSQTTSLALSIVYNGISTVGWNAMNILQVEYFDADVRSTGCGLLNSCARFFIVGTNFLFGAFEATNPTLPILIVAVCLFVGGIAPLFLPLSKQRSWLGKLGINLRGALCRRIKRARSH